MVDIAMPTIELAERLALLLALAFFLGLAFEEIYKRDEPAIPGGIMLPLAPDSRLIAIAPVTPYRTWLAVVAISGLSYLTYLVQCHRPIRGGVLFPALLGGVAARALLPLRCRCSLRPVGVAGIEPGPSEEPAIPPPTRCS